MAILSVQIYLRCPGDNEYSCLAKRPSRRKPNKKQQRYTPEFRAEAGKLASEQGLSQETAKRLAIQSCAHEDERLKVAIKAAHKTTRESYSTRRLQPELAADGFVAGRDHIARLRREIGIHCRQKRKFKATTNSNHNLPVAENLLN